MLFHIRQATAQSHVKQPFQAINTASHAHTVVEILFVATEVKHRGKKFFLQLLRLFMREVSLISFSSVASCASHLAVTWF